MWAAVTAKFSPFFSKAISASLRDLENKLINQLVLSTYGISNGDMAASFSRRSFSNFCFYLSLVVLNTCWVLVLIFSSILLASFVERADVSALWMLLAVLLSISLGLLYQSDPFPYESHGCKFSDSACVLGGNWQSKL